MEILRVAILGWADAELQTPSGFLESCGSRETGSAGCGTGSLPTPEQRVAPVTDAVIRILTELWAETGSETVSEALGMLARGVVPAVLAEITTTLGEVRLEERVWCELLRFDARRSLILEERILVEHGVRATLDQLGSRLGVTRERVRQLERAISDEVERRLGKPENAGVRHLGRRAAAQIGEVSTHAHAAQVIAGLVAATSVFEDVYGPQRRALLFRLSGPYSNVAGLLWTESARERLRALERRVGSLHGDTIDEVGVATALRALGAADELHAQIMTHLGVRSRR
jgi:hypothetical protein